MVITQQWVTFGPYRAEVNARNPARHVAEGEDSLRWYLKCLDDSIKAEVVLKMISASPRVKMVRPG